MLTNYDQIFSNFTEAILLLDKDGYISFSNKKACELTGYADHQLRGQHLAMLYGIVQDQVKAEYELGLARKQQKFVTEGWKSKKDGTKYWAEITLAPLADEAEAIAGYSCMLRDTSARKQDEVALREREERFRLMIEGVKEYAIFLLDKEGHIVTWNEGAQRIKGYLPGEIIGKHFSTFYTKEDLEDKKPEREIRIAIATGKYEEEGWRVKKNGSVFWANVVITALFNDQNQHIGFSKVTRDLSERKENEESLRQSEERFRMLVEQVTDYGIFMMDNKGRIVSWNEGARRINGYEASEIIGKYFSIFYPEEDIMNDKPGHELKVACTEGKYEEEGWRVRKDGSLFWANVVITAVYNKEGVLMGYSKVTRDLTERKESEKALRNSYEQYRRLTEELRGANKALAYTNQELEQFTSIASHDLQEPVRTIKSFLQLIDIKLNKGEYSDLKTYIDKSVTAANRMRELIHNLLQYSQLGKEELVKERINVQELLNQALQNLKGSIELAKADIRIKSDVETVEGARIQLVQLIQNLISNALKFTDTKDPKIKISVVKDDGGVKFSISDNGIGIAKEDMSKVFEIFRRLNTEKTYPGTGIGLAICKKIIDRHGGKIWPESEPGQGTTFYFTLKGEKTEHLQTA